MAVDDIRHLIINPRTKKPISCEAMYKYFRHEIDTGRQTLKGAVGGQYVKKLNRGEWPAIHWGLRNIMGIKDDASIFDGGGNGSDMPSIQVTFVVPERKGNGKDEDGPVIEHE
jgi:hypothetical protein